MTCKHTDSLTPEERRQIVKEFEEARRPKPGDGKLLQEWLDKQRSGEYD